MTEVVFFSRSFCHFPELGHFHHCRRSSKSLDKAGSGEICYNRSLTSSASKIWKIRILWKFVKKKKPCSAETLSWRLKNGLIAISLIASKFSVPSFFQKILNTALWVISRFTHNHSILANLILAHPVETFSFRRSPQFLFTDVRQSLTLELCPRNSSSALQLHRPDGK